MHINLNNICLKFMVGLAFLLDREKGFLDINRYLFLEIYI